MPRVLFADWLDVDLSSTNKNDHAVRSSWRSSNADGPIKAEGLLGFGEVEILGELALMQFDDGYELMGSEFFDLSQMDEICDSFVQ